MQESCLVSFCINTRQNLAEMKRLSVAERAEMMIRAGIDGLQTLVKGLCCILSAISVTSATSMSTIPPDNKSFAGPHIKMSEGSLQWNMGEGPFDLQPGNYPPPQSSIRGPSGLLVPIIYRVDGYSNSTACDCRNTKSPEISGQEFGVGQGRSPSMDVVSSLTFTPQQAQQLDQIGSRFVDLTIR
ncbi:unnamed protein product [Angiostrongylus costaricensis]|uniref:Secreted protein n=1 Tax=Angiostrongylus costaricensis TaxID=334426 RepID=A0A158PGW4_ANGCS|nr:unnamed protein product [Angiostrongylus costaricensis]